MDTGPDVLLYIEIAIIGIGVVVCLGLCSQIFFRPDSFKNRSIEISYLFVSLVLLMLKVYQIVLSGNIPLVKILVFILHCAVILGILVLNTMVCEKLRKFDSSINVARIKVVRVVFYIIFGMGMLPAVADIYYVLNSLNRSYLPNVKIC